MRIRGIATLAALVIVTVTAHAQTPAPQRTLEITGLMGYTAGDVDKWAGVSNVYDWDMAASGFSARLFFKEMSPGRLAVEVGYGYHMWYNLREPYGSSWIYPDRSAESNRALVVLRKTLASKTFLDVGAGLNFFEDFVDPAVMVGLTRLLRDGPKYSFPLGVRVDPILDSEAVLIPITASVGLGIKF